MHAVCCAVVSCTHLQCCIGKQLLMSAAIPAACCAEHTMDWLMLHCYLPRYAALGHKLCWAYRSSYYFFQLSMPWVVCAYKGQV